MLYIPHDVLFTDRCLQSKQSSSMRDTSSTIHHEKMLIGTLQVERLNNTASLSN